MVSVCTVKQEERGELQTTVMEGFVKRKALSISSLTKKRRGPSGHFPMSVPK